jgi:uncharacterized protein DUF1572
MDIIGKAFLETMISRVKYYKDLGDRALVQLRDDDFYFRLNPASNSIAMIIQHMSGNMLSRWTNFLTTDGEKEWRNRDAEFTVIVRSREQLLQLWEDGWACYLGALTCLKEEDLLKTVYIRREGLLVIDAINRQLAHYPYHVGQIVYLARMIKNNEWKTLSIEPGKSADYNRTDGIKDPAKKFR